MPGADNVYKKAQRLYESVFPVLKVVALGLGLILAILSVLGLAYVLLFHLGSNTVMVNIHYGIFIATLFFGAFLFDSIFFSRTADKRLVDLILLSCIMLVVMLVAIDVSGILADIPFSSGSAVSGSWGGAYGNFTVNVTDTQLGNFTAPLVFDMMEHASLIVPGIMVVVAALVWGYRERVVADPEIRRDALILFTLLLAWLLVLAMFGVIMVKTLTFPPVT